MTNEAAYWIALAHLPRWGHAKINNLIIKFYHDNKISPADFFHLSDEEWSKNYQLDFRDINQLKEAREDLPNLAFLSEKMQSEGYEIIPITSPEYSANLKENLKIAHAPALIYVKGNREILLEKSIAIVGSRNATELSLKFTDNIAQLASKEYKVVVSGFAKGVDKQALDSAITYKGQSIIVLPQGIMTFSSGFNKYYRQIVDGDVLVLSTFFPKAPWKAELAMARNPIIYGLAHEIYVAESSDKGGTWSGVMDGLRKNRKIFVRKPENFENNANNLLISKGAVPVDFNGNTLSGYSSGDVQTTLPLAGEPEISYENKILEVLKTGSFPVKEIIKKLNLNWTDHQMRKFLKSQKDVEEIKKKTIHYTYKTNIPIQPTLFD
ncbi:MAG: DNA-processing protein DprA [Bacteroidota bacterium]